MQAQEAHYYINFLLKGFSHVLVTFRVDKDSNPMCGLVRNNFKKVWLKQQHIFRVYSETLFYDLGFKKAQFIAGCNRNISCTV